MASIIEDTVKLLVDCEHRGRARRNQVPPSIFIVPGAHRGLSPSSFNPRLVSIGPLHRKDENLQGFEVQKSTYVHNLLTRLPPKPEETLRGCAEKVIDSLEKIKACYAGLTTYDDTELANIMVVDGCFILEFILICLGESRIELSGTNMFDAHIICYDLLLIENQIPFFVLNIIFECTRMASNVHLTEYIGKPLTAYIEVLMGFYWVFDGNLIVHDDSLASTPDHILGFVHKIYQPAEPIPSVFTLSFPKSYSATELDRAGVNFKPKKDRNWAMAIIFEEPSPLFEGPSLFSRFPWPTLKMRMAIIHDFTELIIRNLLIYEQRSDVIKYVASYVCAMDGLINTPDDVAVLVNSNVLRNYLGSDADAANMINNLCKEVIVPTFYYAQQWEDMDAYCNSQWANTLAWWKRKYFNNPWSFYSLVAAFVLFALTIVQTIFTIKAA